MVWWQKFLAWLKGRKTILTGTAIAVVGLLGAGSGYLDGQSALTLFMLGLSVAGLGAKLNGHQAQVLTAIGAVAQAGADLRAGNAAGALQVAESQGKSLLPGIAANLAPAVGASLNLSAPTTQELLAAVTQLTAQPSPTINIGSGGASAK